MWRWEFWDDVWRCLPYQQRGNSNGILSIHKSSLFLGPVTDGHQPKQDSRHWIFLAVQTAGWKSSMAFCLRKLKHLRLFLFLYLFRMSDDIFQCLLFQPKHRKHLTRAPCFLDSTNFHWSGWLQIWSEDFHRFPVASFSTCKWYLKI